MHRHHKIMIALQLTTLVMLAVVMILLAGCASSRGLHAQNTLRNQCVKWDNQFNQSKHRAQ